MWRLGHWYSFGALLQPALGLLLLLGLLNG
jgi:hypothetical protein